MNKVQVLHTGNDAMKSMPEEINSFISINSLSLRKVLVKLRLSF
jgi:hypothetical protein